MSVSAFTVKIMFKTHNIFFVMQAFEKKKRFIKCTISLDLLMISKFQISIFNTSLKTLFDQNNLYFFCWSSHV